MIRKFASMFANDYVLSIVSKVIVIAFNVLATVFLTRYLGPTLKGQYAYLLNILNLLVVILNFGLYQAYPFFRRSGLESITQKFISLFFYQFIVYLGIGALIAAIATDQRIELFALLLPFMVLTQQVGFLLMVENIRLSNIINAVYSVLYTVAFGLLFLWALPNVYVALGINMLKIVFVLAALVCCVRIMPSIDSFDSALLGRALAFGIYPMLTMLMVTLNYRVSVLILGAHVSFTDIGFFTTGLNLAEAAWILPDACKDVLFARTARSDAIDEMIFGLKLNFWAAVSLVLFVAFAGRYILLILYGREFLPAYGVTVVMFVGVISMVYFKLIGTLFLAQGKRKIYFFTLSASVVANIMLSWGLVPLFGIMGAAISSVLSYTMSGAVFLLIFTKEFKVPWRHLFFMNGEDVRIARRALGW